MPGPPPPGRRRRRAAAYLRPAAAGRTAEPSAAQASGPHDLADERAVSLGVLPTRTPTFSSASFLAWAVPAEPEMIAPAWPIVLPSGAVNPAT